MIRTFTSTLILLTALAGTASAAEIRVSLVGKDAATISAEIHAAAKTVCKREYLDARLSQPYELAACIRQATEDAEAQVKAKAPAPGPQASLGASSSY
jgi:hypothetical protein